MDFSQFAEPHSEDDRLVRRIDLERLPRHIAVIMDGNGRWARERRLPRVAGHREGIASVRETVEMCARLGVEVLTLYAFSQENWKRPAAEVTTLMSLLRQYVRKELGTLLENNIRFKVIGHLEDLPENAQRELDRAVERTAGNDGLQFNIALSYGGRTEIVDACRALLRENADPATLSLESFAQHLYTAGQPDPDLLIRTSGELRVSNFLLWQIAYAEIWVTETLWPDFRREHLFQALIDYQHRERRYGGLNRDEREDPVVVRN